MVDLAWGSGFWESTEQPFKKSFWFRLPCFQFRVCWGHRKGKRTITKSLFSTLKIMYSSAFLIVVTLGSIQSRGIQYDQYDQSVFSFHHDLIPEYFYHPHKPFSNTFQVTIFIWLRERDHWRASVYHVWGPSSIPSTQGRMGEKQAEK